MTYRVVILRRAANDVQQIFDWLAERSPDGARSWYRAWNEALDGLEHRPDRFGLATEGPRRNRQIRESYFRTRRGRTYRILFAIVEQDVRVLHVLGAGQSFPEDLV